LARLDDFTRRTIRVGAVASAFVMLWVLAEAFVLVFGGILLATAASATAGAVSRVTRLPRGFALAAVVLSLPALIITALLLMGPQVVREVNELRAGLPAAIEAANAWLLEQSGLGLSLSDLFGQSSEPEVPWASIASYATVGAGGIVNLVLVGFIGLYLAASPSFYVRGFLRLIPDDLRPRVAHAMEAAGTGLEKWLVGQMMSMIVIGLLSGGGLWLLGMPMAVTLGVLAGILGFVPYLGPLLFTAIAVLFAFAQGPTQALYVLLLCVFVQQLEGEVITPLIQRWAVALPPLLTLTAVLVFGTLFGFRGVLVATPMMVVGMILVEKLYLMDKPPPDAAL
jgi:predicted PurR-regulated permease PerM